MEPLVKGTLWSKGPSGQRNLWSKEPSGQKTSGQWDSGQNSSGQRDSGQRIHTPSSRFLRMLKTLKLISLHFNLGLITEIGLTHHPPNTTTKDVFRLNTTVTRFLINFYQTDHFFHKNQIFLLSKK